ncbi:hypothetical protein CC85DRAFT_286878 [Cutaneotrichosporon oleaginosum]|uniref:Uncharacterized protein n=1 Tax=Cutaneotrichosporon oleaginosum TaxID=879819 RepID=A0A0J0XIN9_9TREE|nr:uncharacterized protein CC85DRAFT_286878 [Cutaneotrichosporon oleaginosum]KLT40955.1 hypothetical protein CC85DRAFT_286878 [Cutaneotrichosporon oleaginosum]TXT06225.1 hypothetical protein COLE_05556 [Cutaneotrichosporon oleaginosum]
MCHVPVLCCGVISCRSCLGYPFSRFSAWSNASRAAASMRSSLPVTQQLTAGRWPLAAGLDWIGDEIACKAALQLIHKVGCQSGRVEDRGGEAEVASRHEADM